MGTIIVIGVFALLVLGAYFIQRKFDKPTDVHTGPPVAALSDEGKKTIHQFTRNHGAPGSGRDHSGIAPVGTAPGGTSIPDKAQIERDRESSKGVAIKSESDEALRRTVEKYGAEAIYGIDACEELARRRKEREEG